MTITQQYKNKLQLIADHNYPVLSLSAFEEEFRATYPAIEAHYTKKDIKQQHINYVCRFFINLR